MSDRQPGSDTSQQPDFLTLPPEFWESPLPPGIVTPLRLSESPVTTDESPRPPAAADREADPRPPDDDFVWDDVTGTSAQVVDPLPLSAPVLAPVPVPALVRSRVPVRLRVSARPPWDRRRASVRWRTGPTRRAAAVAVLVLGAAVLAAIVSRDGARTTGVRPASLQPVQPLAPTVTVQERVNGPAAETTTTAETTAETTTTAAPVVPVTEAPTTVAVSRPPATARPTTTAVTRQSPPPAAARATGPVCGFAAGSTVEVTLNGQALGPHTADRDGCVQVPVSQDPPRRGP